MSAVNVGNPLAINLTCLNTREFTLEKGLLNVMNVENLLPLVLPSVIIRGKKMGVCVGWGVRREGEESL